MKLTKYSQSTFIVENNAGNRLLIDPGKYNYDDGFAPNDFGDIDILIITHKHADHHDPDAEVRILKKNNCVVLTNEEIGQFEVARTNNYQTKKVGDIFESMGFKIHFIATDHFAKCEQVVNFGLLVEADGKSFYHPSDTRFMEQCYYDYEKVKNPDVLCVPISNRGVVMGIDDSIKFASEIVPGIVIPIHYDSPKDQVRVSPLDFISRYDILASRIQSLRETQAKVLKFGESLSV